MADDADLSTDEAEPDDLQLHTVRDLYPGLSDKQARFAIEYLTDSNGTQAAIRAGYSPGSANVQAYKLLRTGHVKEAIAHGQGKLLEAAGVTALGLVKEVARLAFSRMGDFVEEAPKARKKKPQSLEQLTLFGDALKPQGPRLRLRKLSKLDTACISEISEGDDGRVRVKLHSKSDALDKLFKVAGLYAPEKHEHLLSKAHEDALTELE